MSRYSSNMDKFAKGAVENEFCPFCEHPLPVGAKKCACGAVLTPGGSANFKIAYMTALIFFGLVSLVICFCAMTANTDEFFKTGAWGAIITCVAFYFLRPKKFERVWFKNEEYGYRHVLIDE